jgi:hypothetical protein
MRTRRQVSSSVRGGGDVGGDEDQVAQGEANAETRNKGERNGMG